MQSGITGHPLKEYMRLRAQRIHGDARETIERLLMRINHGLILNETSVKNDPDTDRPANSSGIAAIGVAGWSTGFNRYAEDFVYDISHQLLIAKGDGLLYRLFQGCAQALAER
jgi:hypothetical protein